MHRWHDRRKAFRSLLEGGTCVHPASVFDPVSMRIARDLGFEVGMLGGSMASLAVLGAPDLIVLTLSELAGLVNRMARASDLPIMVDADHGYGNALNVMRTVEELETAGACGLSIEDTALPTAHGAEGKPRFVTIEEAVGKLRAALEARRDPDLAIVGRTDTCGPLGADEAARRAAAYQNTGVDAIFLVGVKTKADLELITANVELPLIVGGVGPELMDKAYLASKGVRVCLQGHHTFPAALQAIYATMKHLREGGAPADLGGLPSGELKSAATRAEDYERWAKEFL
ncbi:MAG: isocitrate lyase/PEP mutase family protein [Alphaproteobacteria bacterium]|nr:isocitrate lyase/PEP mutase family protein [Alphaproteobacteria bacterium]